jgi:hypothetical protein
MEPIEMVNKIIAKNINLSSVIEEQEKEIVYLKRKHNYSSTRIKNESK